MRNLRLGIFIAVALVQLGVPIWLIANRERVLRTGTEFHFRTRPADPSDAFRGRYIFLGFDFKDRIAAEIAKKFQKGGKIPGDLRKTGTFYATVVKDRDGYAELAAVADDPPPAGDYVEIRAEVRWGSVYVHLPFDRFYMDEVDAPRAERAYALIRRREGAPAYAVVFIRSGEAVLQDLVMDGAPIREYLKRDPGEAVKEKR